MLSAPKYLVGRLHVWNLKSTPKEISFGSFEYRQGAEDWLIYPQKLNQLNYKFGMDDLIKDRTGINEWEENVSSNSIARELFSMHVW